MTANSDHLTTDSGPPPKIGHIQTESPVTIPWNQRSHRNGMTGHVAPEYAILEEDRKLDAEKLLESTIPGLSKNCKYLPVYKYLRQIGITCREDYQARNLRIDRHVEKTPAEYTNTTYARQFVQTERQKTTQQIIDTNPPEKAAIFLAFVAKEKFDAPIVRQFLVDNIEKLETSNSNYATYFRKAACLYDYYLNGWG